LGEGPVARPGAVGCRNGRDFIARILTKANGGVNTDKTVNRKIFIFLNVS
jgi:hypothetical protein